MSRLNMGRDSFRHRSTAEDVTEGIDATGLIAIVTGGTTGLGMETVRVLALRGAYVFIADREFSAAEMVKEEILKGNPDAQIDYLELDLSSFASIRKAASDFLAMKLPLNILVNNGSALMGPFQLSEDGIEMQFAVNYLGHWIFTNLLLDHMKKTAKESSIEGRIVNVSSSFQATYKGGIRLDSINEKSGYNQYYAYGQAKIASILHARELADRLEAEGAPVMINACHPGAVFTGLQRHVPKYLRAAVKAFTGFCWKSVGQGAGTQCFLALSPDVYGVSGEYFCNLKLTEAGEYASDMDLARKLWDVSVNLTCTGPLTQHRSD